MSDPSNTSPTDQTQPDQNQPDQTKPGPANPAAEGTEAPTPPGGPLRQDGVGGAKERAAAPSSDTDSEPESSPGSTIPIEDEQPDPAPHEKHDLQHENAESSQDQPSGV